MKAVILAGGQGTRLGKLTTEIPKPMIRLMDKPLLEYQVELLKKYGVTDIFITVNYLKDAIIDYFGDGSKYGVNIQYYEELTPLGTVGGVKALEKHLTEDFFVLYGDVMVEMNLHRLYQFHITKNSKATLVLHPNDHPYDSDLVSMDTHGRITRFIPKPHDTNVEYYRNMVNAGLYILSPQVLSFIEKDKKADFGKDIFPQLVTQLPFYGYNTPEYLKDMGTPDRLVRVEEAIVTGAIYRRNLEAPQKAIFLDRDGVLNDDKEFIHVADDLKLLPGVADAVKQINKSEYLALVATNQSVIARNLCTEENLDQIHAKMESDLGKERAYLDKIYYCPHHPHKGYPDENPVYKVDCECRKPKPGMLLQGAEEFNLDLNRSYFIGDHERDIKAGYAAGCITVGVGTGKGLKGSQTQPHYFFMNLNEAVHFIITRPYQSLAQDLHERILSSAHHPYILSIGGLSQAGKSTLSAFLVQYFREQQIPVLQIKLDDWLLPKKQRPAEHNMMVNFQADKIVSDIKRILAGGIIELEGYSKIQGYPPVSRAYHYTGQNLILIEGVPALGIPYLQEISHEQWHVTLPAENHKQRILTYYNWKGYSEEQALHIYNQRKMAEYDVVNSWQTIANKIIEAV